MSSKAPSAGTKVTRGADAPTKQEGAGAVHPESLAAQSSTFTQSNWGGTPGSEETATRGHHAVPGSEEAQKPHSQSSGRKTGQTSSSDAKSDSLENQKSYAGPAPTYVNRLYQKYEGGPKGKNLKEGGFEGEGPGDSILAEPGSEQDPGRGAEQRFGITGRKDGDGAKLISGPQRYGALEPETSI